MAVSKELAQQFMSRFKGLDRAYGRYDIVGNKGDSLKKTGQARTIQGELTLELWEKHLNGEQGLGVVPITDEGECVWGCIDVDIYDADINVIAAKLSTFPFVVCRSKSGGVHAFIFTTVPVPAALMKKKLTEACAQLGFGNLEIFPKQAELLTSRNDIGNWLNMPYFGGENSTRYCVKDGTSLTPEEFLTYAAKKQLTLEDLENFSIRKVDKDILDTLPGGPPCLQILCQIGFHEGGRNNALMNLGVYFKNAYPDDWKQRLEDANRRFFKPPLDYKEIEVTVKSLERKNYNYTCSKPPISAHCDKPTCVKRKYGVRGESMDKGAELPMLGGLVMFNTSPPLFFLDVEGKRVGPLEGKDLQLQDRFQLVCMEQARLMPHKVKTDKWTTKIQELLATADVVELPEDASPEGVLWQHFEHFCVGRSQCEDWDDLAGSNKPYTNPETKITYFKLKDFYDYLQRVHFKDMKLTRVSVELKQRGATHNVYKVKGIPTALWEVPAFDRADVKLKTPEFPGGDF